MSLRDIYESGFDEETGKKSTATACPDCERNLRTDGGEIACTECGLIVNEYHIDHGATAMDFLGDDAQPAQTGAPLTETRHDRGLSTEIGDGRDAKGNRLSSRKHRQLRRLRREHGRARWQSKRERNLGHGCTEIARLTAALSLSYSLREQAASLFRSAQTANLLTGRSIEALAAASVYGACRCNGLSRTLDEVGAVARCTESALAGGYRVLNTELELPVAPRTPADFIPRQAAALDLPAEVQHEGLQLAQNATDSGYAVGRHPAGVAGACLWLAGKDDDIRLRQTDVADVAGVSTTTIRGHRDALMEQGESQ
ncbi:transcription initiation factor IIB [Halorientalis salina]|uniref:transcription initiation factor IIB n=1 Tax=Halorientalis salina TaxID=2932266 RepID=UPI0010ABCD23|nr:transcription initiation factor IIB family protein [Halorientalis salina]